MESQPDYIYVHSDTDDEHGSESQGENSSGMSFDIHSYNTF